MIGYDEGWTVELLLMGIAYFGFGTPHEMMDVEAEEATDVTMKGRLTLRLAT